jgi:hypothetical protein
MDKTTYLNHYYFITVIALSLYFTLTAIFSVDAYQKPQNREKNSNMECWYPQNNIAIVYIYAGLAKLNSDWLLEAIPLKIWLPNSSIFLW